MSITGKYQKSFLSKSIHGILLSSFCFTAYANEQSAATSPNEALLSTIVVKANKKNPTADTTKTYVAKSANTSTKLDLSLRETPQSVSVITKQRMTDQGLNNIQDVLANTPGISVKKYDSSRTSFYARGLPIDNLQIDGSPTPTNYNVSTALDETDMAIFDRVEVIHGAGGLNTGAGNPSAVVNLIRKHPTKEFRANGMLSYGSWNSMRAEADVGGSLVSSGEVRARVGAAYEDKETFYDFQRNTKNVFYGLLDADLTDSTLLTLGADYTNSTPNGVTWGGLPLYYADGSRTDFPRSKNLGARSGYFDKENLNIFISLKQQINENWKAQASLNFQKMDQFSNLINANGFPDRNTGLGMTLWAGQYDYQNTISNLDVNLQGKFSFLGQQHDVVLGWTKNRYVMDDWAIGTADTAKYPFGLWGWGGSQVVNANTWNGNISAPATTRTGSVTRTLVNEDAAYAALRFSLMDNLKVIAGGRLSNWKRSDDAFDSATQQSVKTQAGDSKNKFTPYAGIIYDFHPNLSAYASYTEIFKPNTVRDINYEFLRPEVGDNIELGLKGEFLDKALTSSIAIFKGNQQYKAVTDNSLSLAELAAYKIKYNTSSDPSRAAGKTESKGVELEVNGKITPDWQIAAGYTYAQLEEKQTSLPVDSTIPEQMFRLFTTYRLPGQLNKLTVGGGVDWQSKFYAATSRPTGAIDTSGFPVTVSDQVTQNAYALVNLMARYDINDHLSATLNANNVLDKKYYNNVGFFNTYLYGEPRSVVLSLRAKF